MYKIKAELVRSSYIWNFLKEKLNDSGATIVDIATKKMWLKQYQSIWNVLNGKVVWSDNLFARIAKAIWLKDSDINELFKQADKEEFKYKWWEDVFNQAIVREMTDEEIDEIIRKRLSL